MSDTLTLLPLSDHGMDALVQPSGSTTGTAPNTLITTAMASSVGQSYDITAGAGGTSGSISDQFAALQAKSIPLDLNRSGQSTQDLAPEISSSTRLGNNSGEVASSAGNAASDLLSLSNKTLSQPTDPSTGLPKLQFLSDTTAIKTPAVVADEKIGDTFIDKTALEAAVPSTVPGAELKTDISSIGQNALSSFPETVPDQTSSDMVPDTQLYTVPAETEYLGANTESSRPSMMLRSNAVALSSYQDAPSYSYEASGVVIVNGVINSWANQISLSDNFNRAYPGVVVNTSYDDIGNRRDAAWVQPPMHAYATSDSGSRADTVQTWFEGNADTIGYNVIGTPIPHDRYIALRDWLHGEIKQHHMGNQETVSNVLHMLATQDNQTTTQLNNIWHMVLGVAISSAELTDAVTQISIGHATLSTERQGLAHSSQAAALYAQKYQDVHGHPPSEADIRFAQDKIGNGTSLQQYVWDEAHNGQTPQEFGAVFRQVHGREPTGSDIQFAQQKIGNGSSLQQYRWDEAHNGQTPQEFGDVFRQVHGREPTSADIQFAQQKVGNGSSLQQYRWDEAHNGQTPQEFGDVFRQVHGREPTGSDIQFAQQQIGNGASLQQYRWNQIHSEQTAHEYMEMYRNITGNVASNGDVQWFQNAASNGRKYITLRQDLAWSDHGRNAIASAYRDTVNITPYDSTIQAWQSNLADGGTYISMRQAIVNVHGADAVRQVYRDSVNIVVDDATVESWKANLVGGGSYQAMRKAIVDYHGHAAVQAVFARTAGIQNPEQFQYDVYQKALADGASIADITSSIAHAWEGKQAIDRLYGDVLGREADQSGLKTYQEQLAAGRSLTDVRHDLAYSAEATTHLQRLVSTLVAPDAWNDKLAILQQDLATKDSLLYILGHSDNFIGVRLEDLYSSYDLYPDTLSRFFGVNPENGDKNCVFCSNAMIDRIYNEESQTVAPLSDYQDLEGFDPNAFVSDKLTVNDVDNYMRKLGDGEARALVLEASGSPIGHAIVAYNDKGIIRYLDGQKGWEVKLKDNLKIKLVHRSYDDPQM